jgi:guanosine-3',5'-bis(diphosphate) 3'-pyrophosphohydrolase
MSFLYLCGMVHGRDIASQELVKRYRKLLRVAAPVLGEGEIQQVREAFRVAEEACKKANKSVWEPQLLHALDIALVVAGEMGLGLTSIQGALLYNIYEYEAVGSDIIEQKFGKQVAEIIQSLAKIAQINTSQTRYQAENFRKLMLSLASDVRVLLIKLAERLADMRQLDRFPGDRKIVISSEAFYLYAPLAHRLGIYAIKSEMEDLCMHFTEHAIYADIEKKIRDTEEKRNKYIREFIAPIRRKLSEQGFDFEIRSRTKSIFSIWSKMKKQGVPFEEIYDLFALRIILNSERESEKGDCWQAYSVVTDFYQPNPQRLRDWISVPKSNGYESLHITVVGPQGKWVEVQIRTRRMDEIAEKGLAAHWKYKGGTKEETLPDWLGKMRDMLEKTEAEAGEFIDNLKLNLYADEVFVFTPKAELKRLPAGATVLDFAFDIHTQVGYRCAGARVNQRNVPIKYVLQNGDQVEIITSSTQKPKLDWLNFVVTTRARTKIRQALSEEKMKAAEAGKELLQRRLRNWKIPFNDENVKKLLVHFRQKLAQDLYAMIFQEKIDLSTIKDILTGREKEEEKILEPALPEPMAEPEKAVSRGAEDFLLIDEKMDNIDFRLARCCNPIFGDEIFGFVTVHEGIKIHRVNCPNAAQMITRYGYRIVKARWKRTYGRTSFQTSVRVSGIDELGMVNKISDVISKDLKVNMRSITMESKDGLFEGIIKVYVTSTTHLDGLLKRLMQVKGVTRAIRYDENIDKE